MWKQPPASTTAKNNAPWALQSSVQGAVCSQLLTTPTAVSHQLRPTRGLFGGGEGSMGRLPSNCIKYCLSSWGLWTERRSDFKYIPALLGNDKLLLLQFPSRITKDRGLKAKTQATGYLWKIRWLGILRDKVIMQKGAKQRSCLQVPIRDVRTR